MRKRTLAILGVAAAVVIGGGGYAVATNDGDEGCTTTTTSANGSLSLHVSAEKLRQLRQGGNEAVASDEHGNEVVCR